MFRKTWFLLAIWPLAGVIFTLASCSRTPTPAPASAAPAATSDANAPPPPTDATSKTSDEGSTEEHPHKPGAHGGIIVPIGSDSYHAEAVFEKGGVLRLFMLGKDEAKVEEVQSQTLTAYAKPADGTESTAFEIKPEQQQGDSEGKTSQFVGQVPEAFADGAVDVTIPIIRIGGDRFRIGFSSKPESHGEDIMPDKVADEEEVELYLKPGGVYTDADIEANGRKTASQKFKGFMSKHDMKPKPGDKICPVTMTKANPQCTWIVGGKEYEFCCPPCVDEFVKLAKQNPTEVQDPDAYIKR